MKAITFTKMHGLGNSYIYIDGRTHHLSENDLSKLAISVSSIHTGIGSDGLIFIELSSKAHAKMRIFNKDGSEAKNCGNGLRCVAKYAYEHGFVNSKEMTIETLSGIVNAHITSMHGDNAIVSVNMGKPKLARHEIPMNGISSSSVVAEPFSVNNLSLALTAISVGNPHAVFFIPDINTSPHLVLGPKIEKDPRFPQGINVEFVTVLSPTELAVRVWERGSGLTQSCGTGACAAVVAAVLNQLVKRDEDITVHLEGGDLIVRWAANNDIIMTGPATTIATGALAL